MSDLVNEIMSLETNKEKVERFLELGLNPKYGLSAKLTQLMYDLYQMSSGDGQYNGRWNCGACQDTIYRKLNDFVNYGDNVGKPLINWEKEIVVKKKKKNDNGSDQTEITGDVE